MTESSDTLVLKMKSAGRMPATVPSAGPKKRTDESPRGKEDPNPETGGAGWGATGRNRRSERPQIGAQDVSKAHEAKQTTKGSSTATKRLQPCREPARSSRPPG